MKPRLLLTFVLTSLALLTACDSTTGPRNAAASASTPATAVVSDALLKTAHGFDVGPMMSARTIYVFFDSQCPHCGHLWKAAQPLQNSAHFVWIPVAALNKASLAQGATLLAASDPITLMNQHEESMAAHHLGLTADSAAVESKGALVEANTKLLKTLGTGSIPLTIYRHPVTGEFIRQEGAMTQEQFKTFLAL